MHSFLRMRSALSGRLLRTGPDCHEPASPRPSRGPGTRTRGSGSSPGPSGLMVINRIYCGLSAQRRDLRGLHQLVDHRRRILAQGYRRPVRLQLRASRWPASSARTPTPTGGATPPGAQFFSPRGDNERRGIPADLQRQQPGRRRRNWPEAAQVPRGRRQRAAVQPAAPGPGLGLAGRRLVPLLGRQPRLQRRPRAPARHPGRAARAWAATSRPATRTSSTSSIPSITSRASDPAAYAAVRPGMRELAGRGGQPVPGSQRGSASGSTFPDAGYTISNLFAAFGADMDVAEAGANFASVNVPFSLGYTYEHTFAPAAGWTFDPASSVRRSSPAPASWA